MRDYGKVYSTFWSSDTTSGMSDDGKILALYLMTCSHSTIAGVFRLPDGYVSEDLAWPLERVSKGFVELFQKGFANRCETTKWVWVRKHLEWNKPENPNQRKAAAKVACSVPDQCAWKRDFWRSSSEVLALEQLPEENPPGTVPPTLPEPFRNQKQEQKQEQEISGDLLPDSPEVPEPSMFAIPLNDSTEYQVPPKSVREWVLAFPAVDVEQELREMRAWSLANKAQRKTLRGVDAFIVRWLSKAQDTPSRTRGAAAASQSVMAGVI